MYITRTRPIKTGEIADHLYAIRTASVNFFIYKGADAIIGIDTGFGNSLISRELKSLDIDPGSVTHLFLTHSDFDHCSGLAFFTKAKIYLSAAEEQMITGQKARLWGFIYNARIRRSHQLLNDQDEITAGSIKVRAISTPGHTPGSMSYLLNESILFSGDTFKLVDNQVCLLRRYINMDMAQQETSIRKLAKLDDVHLACTAHWGCTNEFSAAIDGWK